MALAPARVSMPSQAKKDEIIEFKALVRHPMETGYRVDSIGLPIPRNIITLFTVTYGGVEIFRMDMYPAIAANPFVSFFTIAKESGKFDFEWIGDNGFSTTASASIVVE